MKDDDAVALKVAQFPGPQGFICTKDVDLALAERCNDTRELFRPEQVSLIVGLYHQRALRRDEFRQSTGQLHRCHPASRKVAPKRSGSRYVARVHGIPKQRKHIQAIWTPCVTRPVCVFIYRLNVAPVSSERPQPNAINPRHDRSVPCELSDRLDPPWRVEPSCPLGEPRKCVGSGV